MQKHQISLRRVGVMLVQTGRDSVTDNVAQWAAAIASSSLLSFFPLLLAGVSLAAYVVDPHWAAREATQALGEFLPRGQRTVSEVVQQLVDTRGSTSVFSILLLLVSGSRVFGVLTIALNLAFDVDETYGFLKRSLVELVMTLTLGALFVLAISSGFLLRVLGDVFRLLPAGEPVFEILKLVAPAVLLLGVLFLVYHFVPRGEHDPRASLVGAATATALFMGVRPLFTGYVGHFARLNLIYGSLSVVVVLLLWAWVAALITLLGGELASHTHMMLIEGRSAREVEQRHVERAPVKRIRPAGKKRRRRR